MKTVELIAPCHFGMEAVLKREIQDLGYEISRVEDGKVTFLGDMEAICYGNIFLRTADRILLQVGRVHAETYDELFERIKRPSVGRLHTGKRKILGDEGYDHQE